MSSSTPGTHLLIDVWGAQQLTQLDAIELTLQRAAQACGATVLAVKLHAFGENAGVTGVALLAESHISIHTWPEHQFAALDVFMCGSCNPRLALPILLEFFQAQRVKISEIERGSS